MMKAKIVSKNVIDIIDYDDKVKNIKKEFDMFIISNSIEDEIINAILKKKDNDRTESDLVKIVLRKTAEDEYKKSIDLYSDYKNFESIKYDGEELGELDRLEPYYEEDNDNVYQKFRIIKNDPYLVKGKIDLLKQQLLETDYQVMKCYEASLNNSEMPYNIELLTKDRQTKRDEINRLKLL